MAYRPVGVPILFSSSPMKRYRSLLGLFCVHFTDAAFYSGYLGEPSRLLRPCDVFPREEEQTEPLSTAAYHHWSTCRGSCSGPWQVRALTA